jgi:hypothetical protein
MNPVMQEAWLKRGLALVVVGASLPHLPLEVSSHPYVTCLSNVEGWWIACRWSNLMQLNHSGIRHVCVGLFRHHRSLVVPIEGGWPLFHSQDKGISPETCENGKWGDSTLRVQGGLVLSPERKAPLELRVGPWYVKENDELRIMKASALLHASSRWPRKRIGK